MVKALFDTNVLIDYLNTVPQAEKEIGLYTSRFISAMTWIEVMVGAAPATQGDTRAFLNQFGIVQLDESVAEEAVALRRKFRMKLPDAIIWASAKAHGLLFVTRNAKDFPANEPGIRMPYKI